MQSVHLDVKLLIVHLRDELGKWRLTILTATHDVSIHRKQGEKCSNDIFSKESDWHST